jgi:hypothetical protein
MYDMRFPSAASVKVKCGAGEILILQRRRQSKGDTLHRGTSEEDHRPPGGGGAKSKPTTWAFLLFAFVGAFFGQIRARSSEFAKVVIVVEMSKEGKRGNEGKKL